MQKVKIPAIGFSGVVLLVLSAALLCSNPHTARAQEMLNPGMGLNDAASGNGNSDSYQAEGTITWYEEGASDSFQMSLFEASPDESSSSSVATGDAGSNGASRNAVPVGGGGKRQATTPAVARPQPVVRPAAPIARPIPNAPVLPGQVTAPTGKPLQTKPSALVKKAEERALQRSQKLQPPHRPSIRSIRQKALGQRLAGSMSTDSSDPCITDASHAVPPAWLAISGALAIGVGRSRLRASRAHRRKRARRKDSMVGHAFCLMGLLCLVFAAYSFKDAIILSAHAENTVPQIRLYNGNLRKPNGTAVTTAHSIRFSYWNTSDAVPSDLTATGSINPNAPQYLGWYEEHVITPNNNGAFSVKLGSIRPILDLTSISITDAINLHLQVEVKPAGMPDSAYELIDVKPADPLQDRTQILPVPFARNADLLDLRDVGTGSGDIPFLGSGGLLRPTMIPGGTNADTFVIDANGSVAAPALQFGNSLTKTISYSNALGRFNFSDDLHIEGNLTVTGLINGVDVTNLTDASNTHLKVSSGAGLTMNIAGGNYRMGKNTVSYAGATGVSVPNNATSVVFFGSGGLQVRVGEFPTDESAIQLATVTTSGGVILSVQDKRLFLADSREQSIRRTLTPAFEGAAYKADGTDNIGQLSILYDDTIKSNYYAWTSTRSTLQDYDVVVAVTLPQEFVRWQGSGAITVTYRTSSVLSADNALDIALFDTAGAGVALSGAANLAGTSWTTAVFNIGSVGTWNPNGTFLIRLKMKAKDLQQVHIGGIKLGTVSLIGS